MSLDEWPIELVSRDEPESIGDGMMPLLQKRKHVMMDFETQLSEMQILMSVVGSPGVSLLSGLVE